MATQYHVYANTGAGDPINYSAPVATVSAVSWTSSVLSHPGTWSFGVRAFDTVSALEEENLDCAVSIVLDASGNDITSRPPPPLGLRAFALAGGAIRAEWYYPQTAPSTAPSGFHVYMGIGGSPNYASPVATILFGTSIANAFVANLAGLTGGTAYTIGVRAYNAISEEANTNTVSCIADSVGPSAVTGFTITTTTQD